MSEGGLELSAPGMHSGTSEDAETRSDQAVRVPGSQPGDIREHPDTPAPVSREVSADAYDGPLSALRNNVEDLAVALAIWEARQEDAPDPHARRCASDAVGAIDGALAQLHKIRQQLIGEIRVSDDQAAARVDALLAGRDPDDFPGPAGHPEDEPWTRTPDRAVWRAYKGGLVLTLTRLAGGGWQATIEGPGVTERSPMLFRTHKGAQAWADNRAGDAS